MKDNSVIIAALRTFARQRPGLEFGNYGDVRAYNAEARSIQKDLKQADELMRAVTQRSITGDELVEAAKHAFSGRLSINVEASGNVKIDYTTGQYWPTEYRKAVCSVLSAALWAYWRDCTKEGEGADVIRKMANQNLSRGVVKRWFN